MMDRERHVMALTGQQSYWYREPAAELAGLVTGFHAYAENGQRLEGLVETASLTVPLIISFDGSFRIGLGQAPTPRDRYASFAAGLFLGPIIMDSDGDAQCLQVNFTPLGGRQFFNLPMQELADRMVALSDLGDRQISELAERLGELNDWDARLALAERFVHARLLGAQTIDPATRWAFGRLDETAGAVKIGDLSSRLDWSRRRLVQRFREDLGLPPKAIARILRFKAAEAMAAKSDKPDWADIAFAAGYADQAHLTREFVELAGRTPTGWRAAA